MVNQPQRNQIMQWLVVATIVVSLCFLGFIAMVMIGGSFIVEAVMVGKTGPVTTSDDWPDPLKLLGDELDEKQLDRSSIQAYCLCRGMDWEYVWRMDSAPGLFEHIEKRWELTEIKDPDRRFLAGYSSLSGIRAPQWWSPKQNDQTSFHVSPAVIEREKGDRFQVAFDEQNQVIFINYWFNF